MSKEVNERTGRKFLVAGLVQKETLKCVATQIKIELRAAISRIRIKSDRNDSEVLQNVATCQSLLCNRVAETLSDFARYG